MPVSVVAVRIVRVYVDNWVVPVLMTMLGTWRDWVVVIVLLVVVVVKVFVSVFYFFVCVAVFVALG